MKIIKVEGCRSCSKSFFDYPQSTELYFNADKNVKRGLGDCLKLSVYYIDEHCPLEDYENTKI